MFSSFGDHYDKGSDDDDSGEGDIVPLKADDEDSVPLKDDDDEDSDCGIKGGRSTRFEQMMIGEMMNELMNDPRDAHKEDIGIFIEQEELEMWWDAQGFEPDDKPYQQHSFGTKLMPDDPNSPTRLTILGSKMVPDWDATMRRTGIEEYQSKTPHYIVKHKACRYEYDCLSMVAYLRAHGELDELFGGWKVGWNDADEQDNEYDNLVEVAEANQREKYAKEEEEDRGVMLDHNQNLADWNSMMDGPIADAFWNASFTLKEKQKVNRRNLGPFYNDDNLTLRKLIAKLVMVWTDDKAGGVILANQRRTKFQVIEYYGPKKDDQGQPVIDIQYANSPSRRDAEKFLRDEEIRFITCSDGLAKDIENHIMHTALGKGLNDVMSGLLLFEARLIPMRPTTCPTESDNSGRTKTFESKSRLPDGTFGVEFELSCAIGTQQEGVGRTLQQHAAVTVKIRERKFTKPGFRYLYLCDKEQVTDQEWTICHDESIQTNPDWANSSKFELVSPILNGNDGLDECRRVLKTVTDTSAVQINTSMGMHVHIGVPGIELNELKSICQNFVLYEGVMDSFLGRTDNKYCRSNQQGIDDWACIAACDTMGDLFKLMNPQGRYHKLNLNNLRTGKRPTIEFRQHSANSDATKAEAWIRFCMAFVNNSRSNITVLVRTEGTNNGYEDLFDKLIRDDGLKEYYRTQCIHKQQQLDQEN